MSIPTGFPAWLQMPDGTAAMVVDLNGYRAGVAAGGAHTVATPAKTTIVSGGRTQTVQQIALANDEVDARPGGAGRNR
jgi:hypothetical protein